MDNVDYENNNHFNFEELNKNYDEEYENYLKAPRKSFKNNKINLVTNSQKSNELTFDLVQNLNDKQGNKSPSYSPLETLSSLAPSIEEIDSKLDNNLNETNESRVEEILITQNEEIQISQQKIYSQIISLNSQLNNDLTNGFTLYDKILIDPLEKPVLYNNFASINEIILCSDVESQSYHLNTEKIMNTLEDILKLKYELNVKINEPVNENNQDLNNNDYSSSLKDCSNDILVLMNEMIDKIEYNSNEEIKRRVLIKEASIKEKETTNDEVLEMVRLIRNKNKKGHVNHKNLHEKTTNKKDYCQDNIIAATNVLSSSSNLNSSKDQTSKILNQNKIEFDLIRKIEYLFFTLIKDSHKNCDLKSLDVNLCDLNEEQSKFLFNQHMNKLNNEKIPFDNKLRWLVLIRFCHASIDILFNCDWICFLDMIPNFIQSYPIKKFEGIYLILLINI